MSLLQKFFDTDFWKQRVKALSRDLNTTLDKLCEVTEKWRSAEKEVSDLKAEVQLAEADFDEMANLYAALHKAFDDLVDTNADLKVFSANKLREATLHKTTNEKLQRDIVDLQQYNAAVTTEVKKLQVASAEWDSMYKGYVTATNENSRLKAEKDSLSKTLAEAIERYTTTGLEKNRLQTENSSLIKRLNDSYGQPELRIKNSNLEHELEAIAKDRNSYRTKYVQLTDKVKVVEGIVKELMPVSMRFQTALFDLIEVPNVSGT